MAKPARQGRIFGGKAVTRSETSDALTEIGAFFRKCGKIIIPLTVDEILNKQIARKLA